MGRGSTFILRGLKMSKRSRKRRERNAVVDIAASPSPAKARTISRPVLSPSPSFISPLVKKTVVRATSPNSNYSRISGEAARLSQHKQRVAAMPSIAEKQRHRSKLSLAPVGEPDARKSSEKAREPPHCKKRPDSKRATRGGGGSKRYVPWCG